MHEGRKSGDQKPRPETMRGALGPGRLEQLDHPAMERQEPDGDGAFGTVKVDCSSQAGTLGSEEILHRRDVVARDSDMVVPGPGRGSGDTLA